MKTFAISLISSVCVIAAISWPQTSRAQTVPLFQTTFSDANCAQWTQANGLGDSNVCQPGDGISGEGAWTASPGAVEDKITSVANMAAGGGGKGFRHAVGDGASNNGGGIILSWTPVAELWMRFYVRYPVGFAFDSADLYSKLVYFNQENPTNNPHFYWGYHGGATGGYAQNDGVAQTASSPYTWNGIMGGTTGDGLWHSYEIHVKMNTGTNDNGVWEWWIDGNLAYSVSNIKFSNNAAGITWHACAIGENFHNPANGGVVFVDFDDIAISTTGYIGPIGPKNLRVQ